MRSFPPDFRLYLASRSPRRRELLEGLEVPFIVVPAEAEERLAGDAPEVLAEANARAKIRGAELPGDARGAFVLGTDTVVVVGDRLLGKPLDRREARYMLELLAGRSHQVISGVALARVGEPERAAVDHARTSVRFSSLTDQEIDAYLASGEWEGKAGAYAIQGLAGLLIPEIHGEYANVVGLPIHLLHRLFRRLGFDLLAGEWL